MADALTVSQLEELARFAYEEGDVAEARKRLEQADALKASQAADRGALGEAGYATGAGAIRGATGTVDFFQRYAPFMSAGLPLNIATAIFGESLPTAEAVEEQPLPVPMQETAAELTGGYSEYRSPTTLGQFGGTIGEFTGGAAAMPIGGPLRAIGSSILPAIASETGGQLAEGTPYESQARLGGALLVPGLQAAGTPVARRLAIGDPSEVRGYMPGTQRPQSVDLLRRLGIKDISAGQELGSEALMRLEGRMEATTPAKQQLTQAVLREAGTEASLATPDVMLATRNRIGDVFDRVDAMAGGAPTRAEGGRMVEALEKAQGRKSIGKVPDDLQSIVKDFAESAFSGDPIDPKNISKTRTDLNEMMTTYLSDGDTINYELAYDVLQVLDDMIERQIQAVDPDMVGQLAQARRQYRAFLTAERALNRGGSDAASGLITPNALTTAARRREGVSYTRGTGSDLAELARASQEVLTPLPAVSPGGVRDIGGLPQKVVDFLPGLAASTMQRTLPMSGRDAISQMLLQRVARQTGGLLAID